MKQLPVRLREKVILDANNINIRGSQVVSDDLTQIQAKENISITTAENQYSNQFEQTVKKSGFSASLRMVLQV